MRIVKAYKWKKEDSIAFAIYVAEHVIDLYEKQYPNDDRPRKAIEAAKAYLKNPTKKNKDDANASAYAAAYAAANAANSAAYAANAAANAANAAMWNKLGKWMERRIKTLEEIV